MKINPEILDSYFLGGTEERPSFIPIINEEDDEVLNKTEVPSELPILPLRNTVLFPGVVIPISIGREKSVKLIKDAAAEKKMIGIVAQIDAKIEDPEEKDLHRIGTLAQIIKVLEMPDGSSSVIIQGKKRFQIEEIINIEPYFTARVTELKDVVPKLNEEFNAIIKALKEASIKIIQLSANIVPEASFAIKNIDSPSFLINFISSNTDIVLAQKQKLLETNDLAKRAMMLLEHLSLEQQKLELKDGIQSKVKIEFDQRQKEYFLNQQIKVIQEELGGSPQSLDIDKLKKKAKKKKWDAEVKAVFEEELEKLNRHNPAAPDYSMQLNYLETLVELPWNEFTKDNHDLSRAQKILDEDHFGLEKVKDRILEYLAILKLKGDLKSPIICLYGPPGVGKTSLGRSVARALRRKYVRMSLGGLHDEAEIRGHRKTYIGAMPGRIIQNLKKVKSANPVFILDEIDKVGHDFRGDPAYALLEVLDPEQNKNFHDNFLELDFDLSKILFIATANDLGPIKPALRDRMEIINVTGYVVEEKIEIALRYLLPKQLKDHGVKRNQLKISKGVLEHIVVHYTRESGVRELNNQIARVVRNIAKKIGFGEKYTTSITIEDIREILGVPKVNRSKYQGNDLAGVVTGLAWTAFGGEILFVETSLSRGKGGLTLTGNLGQVMKESAMLALEYIKANCDELNISDDMFENWGMHIHIPEGAIPKDGPSAGITLVTSMVSALTQRKVKKNIAMTGEITLRGKVLPVGGIKEKMLAAKRAEIKEVILSKENQNDIEEINPIYLKGLKFHYVDNIMDVLGLSLLKEKVKNAKNFDIAEKES